MDFDDETCTAATAHAVKAATHLTAMDSGAVFALMELAGAIDAINAGAEFNDEDEKPRSFDNVTIPTYLKYCESLGLTPAGRLKLGTSKGATGGKLGDLRSVPRPKAAG